MQISALPPRPLGVAGTLVLLALACASLAHAQAHAQGSAQVPTDLQLPGTQPEQVPERLAPSSCQGCHGNYDAAVEPLHTWGGSMMAHSGRDPMFWAAVALAEQSFEGAGDYCIRCHSPAGWLGGRSTPTDGSSLNVNDAEGVTCHTCHTMTNPNDSEYSGTHTPPFVANDGAGAAHIGSGQYVLLFDDIRLGPYSDPTAPHAFGQSQYHRSADLCGTCHDVSNPLVGDLAPGNGAQQPLPPGKFSDVPGDDVDAKAAFNNLPHTYGVVERTYSEHMASALSSLKVSDYASLPAELQDGRIRSAWLAALQAGNGGDYADGTTRVFSCQSCHMMPAIGQGCSLNPPVRQDLPVHDLTGGNYWMPQAIEYLHARGKITVGNAVDANKLAQMADGRVRALQTLAESGSLSLSGNTLRVVNLTGHKLISGYTEGRRMWVNTRWFDADGVVLREDGKYGQLTVQIDGVSTQVQTLLDPHDPNTRLYEARHAITQDWAVELVALGVPGELALAYHRVSGAVTHTLADLAAMAPGSAVEGFHFLFNNKVLGDNRIPPYGYSYDEAKVRNALPLPASLYGNPGVGGTYNYFDEITLSPPLGARTASIALKYQPTSWEYIQFLHLGNDGSVPFLADTGEDLLEAWLNTQMAAPADIATVQWVAPADSDQDGIADASDNCADVPNADQRDADNDSIGTACDADLTQDCVVNFADLALMKDLFFSTAPGADFDGDGNVTFVDLAIMKTQFFAAPGPGAPGNLCAAR